MNSCSWEKAGALLSTCVCWGDVAVDPWQSGDSGTPHFAGSPVSTAFTTQAVPTTSSDMSDASLTLAYFEDKM